MTVADSPLRRMPGWLQPRRAFSPARLRATVAGRLVLITGASSGIGAACARLLAAHGARVLLLARREDELAALCAAIRSAGGQAEYRALDLNDLAAVNAFAESLTATPPDFIISNAGKSLRRSVIDSCTRPQDIGRCLHVNFHGPVLLLQGLLPAMRARGSGGIVNVSSVVTRLPPAPLWSAYQASKAGFDLWFRTAGAELAGDGLRLGSLYLPLVHTPMSAPTGIYARVPGMTTDDAAACVARLVCRGDARLAPWWLWPLEVLAPWLGAGWLWLARRQFARGRH
ncbi:SDR family NAD(P)-dependent oxidoreductase [Chitinilyticum litopenaei]|uniref:SDR family NAD(P)-dependent oxidoreductase n=1 Tax=Chitinilyticum litopenaei TaxID=1121276 RepID=UPI0004036012|nr:SDR family NAD(P)-dependent oxidoreductase [Chitinilyticum litopenaei]